MIFDIFFTVAKEGNSVQVPNLSNPIEAKDIVEATARTAVWLATCNLQPGAVISAVEIYEVTPSCPEGEANTCNSATRGVMRST